MLRPQAPELGLNDAASTDVDALMQQNAYLKDALEGCRTELGDVYDRVRIILTPEMSCCDSCLAWPASAVVRPACTCTFGGTSDCW